MDWLTDEDVVTMNAKALLQVDDEAVEVARVYPEDADEQAGKLSVCSDMGTAILGHKEGDGREPLRQRPGPPDACGRSGCPAQGLGCGNHVGQRGNHLRPLARLEATVRIHPQALRRHTLRCLLHQLHDVRLRRDVGRVDVVHAGPDLVGILEALESVQQLMSEREVSMVITSASMAAMAWMMSLNSE